MEIGTQLNQQMIILKTKEEGRRKKEEGWNWDGDLNPYLKVNF